MRGVEQIPWLYDSIFRVSEALGFKRWREKLVQGLTGRVLEVGCGTGRNLNLYGSGVRLVGLDVSPEALAAARKRAPQVPLVRASAEALPFRDGTFDAVVSGLVFCSVPDPIRGLRELRRVLKPTGVLRMLEHVRSTYRLYARVQDLIQPAWTKVAGGCHPNRDTEANVRAAGFEIEPEGYRARGTLRRFTATLRNPAPRSADASPRVAG